MVRIIELRNFLTSLFGPRLSWRLGKHILKDSSKSHSCRRNDGLIAAGPFSLSCPEDQGDSRGRKRVTTQSAGDFLGLPMGGSGGSGSLGEGRWKSGVLSAAQGERKCQSGKWKGATCIVGGSLTPSWDSRLWILEELGPFSREEVFILSKSHDFLSLPTPVTLSSKYLEKERTRKVQNKKPEKFSREGKWNC